MPLSVRHGEGLPVRADGVGAPGRDVARLLASAAVLLGLFLMHSAPAPAAGGCHGAMAVSAFAHPRDAAPMGADSARDTAHPGRAHPGHAHPALARVTGAPSAPAAHAPAGGMHGDLCVSTPARGHGHLPTAAQVAAVALAALLAWSVPGRPWGRARPEWCAPPPGGRTLLLHVCVART